MGGRDGASLGWLILQVRSVDGLDGTTGRVRLDLLGGGVGESWVLLEEGGWEAVMDRGTKRDLGTLERGCSGGGGFGAVSLQGTEPGSGLERDGCGVTLEVREKGLEKSGKPELGWGQQ